MVGRTGAVRPPTARRLPDGVARHGSAMAVVNSSGRSNRPTWHRFTRPLTTVVLHGRRRAFLHLEDVHGRPDMGHLGSRYGGWSVAMDALSRDSVCYLAGV